MQRKKCSPRARSFIMIPLVCAVVLGWIAHSTSADMIFRGSDGSQGTISHLGDDQTIFRDAHGNTGPIRHPGGQGAPTIVTPQGQLMNGSVTPFGSPSPPNQLTPAPVLPLNQRLGSAPASTLPPIIPFTPSNSASFGGRR